MCYKKANYQHRGRHHHRHARKKQWWKQRMANAFSYPPVNVQELDDHYEIQFYAAGYEKKDFKITLEDNMLLVAVEKERTETNSDNWKRRGMFQPGSFKRHFELNEKIDKESITASYKNGVLLVSLQKLPGKETVRQEIKIS